MERTHKDIYIVALPEENKVLRTKAVPFDFAKHDKKDISALVARMKKIMHEANGIGLAANQIGLPYSVFVAEVPGDRGPKFYAVFNPVLEKLDKEKVVMEEGCLSVPRAYGDVDRPAKVTLSGMDRNGRPVKIRAWGLLARVFQHEVDHLVGTVFIDKCKKVFRVEDPEKIEK